MAKVKGIIKKKSIRKIKGDIHKGSKLTKNELAKVQVLIEEGYTPTKIAKGMGRNHHTIIRYLRDYIDRFQDPEVQRLVEKMRETEISDLELLNQKAKKRLHDIFDDEQYQPNVIESTAVMDRTFNQKETLRKHLGEEASPKKLAEKIANREGELEELNAELRAIREKYGK